MADVTFATSEALMGLRALLISSKMRCTMVGGGGGEGAAGRVGGDHDVGTQISRTD